AKERSVAIAAAKAMGLNVCGVDMLRSSRGPLIMEVNSSPGLEGIERASGKDIADLIVEVIEKKVEQNLSNPNKTKTKGKG
ncbi:MAG: 30S ribosomal protein S6--L-glutamate ligase, partial [Campylobacterales bacterium]|nr:30S ribosomal protein S6--L-glutamate ligase [Campylobacterales bacterium]